MNEKKFRKVYLVAIWTVTLIVVIYCSIRMYCRSSEPSGTASGSDITTLAEFDSIDADVSAMNVTVRRGTGYSLTCSDSGSALKYSVTDGVLKVTRADAVPIIGISHSDMSLVIEIPEDASLKKTDIETDAGNVTLEGLSSGSVRIETDAGNVVLSSLKAGTIDVETDAGNVKAGTSTFDSLRAKTDMGNITVSDTGDLQSFGIDAAADLGTVRIAGSRTANSYHAQGTGSKSIHAETSMGNIEIE